MKKNDIGKIATLLIASMAIPYLLIRSSLDTSRNDIYSTIISPEVISETVHMDADDPAIWIHPKDLSQSLIIGTDKGGFLFAFDLEGKIVRVVSDPGILRLNNVDVEYGMELNGELIDIAVVTDRDAQKLYVFRLPDLKRLDAGGIEAFEGERERKPMGIGLYKRPKDGAIFAIVSRKRGPSGRYLWQYRLQDDGAGNIQFIKVREFGQWSGCNDKRRGEIEAVAVDDPLGYIYYSDELFGIRKYHADPDAADANKELAIFGKKGFTRDREGICIYQIDSKTGYILVSDQQAHNIRIYTREGAPEDAHKHHLVKVVPIVTKESDGTEITNLTLTEKFPSGLFIAMSNDRTYHFYSWREIAGQQLKSASVDSFQK